jgi:Flp pilus assembly protein TadD
VTKLQEASAIAKASRELLHRGDAIGAERVLTPVLNSLRTDASALHLMGLIKKAQDQLAEAERYLRSAIAHALSEGGYYNDLGVVLQARGQYAEAIRVYRAAHVLMPEAEAVRVNLVRCLMAAGDLAEAEREARLYIDAKPGPEAWTLLGQVQRALERHDAALSSAAAALEYAPNLRGLRLNYAGALERVGRPGEALELYKQLIGEKLDSPELALSGARGLFQAGARKEAEALLEQAVQTWPNAALHGTLARMRIARGEGEAATALIEAEIVKNPGDVSLWLACADALHRGKQFVKAVRVLDLALQEAPDTPALLTAFGFVLDELDRPSDALTALRRVAQLAPVDRTALRNLLSTLLRARKVEEAIKIARDLRVEDPNDQYLLAIEGTALRMLGDRRHRVLYDYDRLVRIYDISPPRGFFTTENLNAALADVLRKQHRVNARPLDQKLHQGAQTARTLLTLDEPAIKGFLTAVDEAVRDYISRLKADVSDPVGWRRTERYRFSGLWSTRLTHEGWLPNHVHDRGWLSATYYVSLMAAEKPKDGRAGWLKFGEPPRSTPGCDVEVVHEPKVGRLVLHPSYFWHGTVPFEGAERLSLSFDVIPG